MYLYVVNRAFTAPNGKLYSKDDQITDDVYKTIGDNQVFVNKIFSGTQAELDAEMKKNEIERTGASVTVEPGLPPVIQDGDHAARAPIVYSVSEAEAIAESEEYNLPDELPTQTERTEKAEQPEQITDTRKKENKKSNN
jgi:hypothetical protein